MEELLLLLPDIPNVFLVPVIMLITAVSVAIIVVGIRVLVGFSVKLVRSIVHKRSDK